MQTTEQGGESATPLPQLKIIDWTQNSLSGSLYGQFLNACKLPARKLSVDPQYGNGNFLVVPVPSALDPMTSMWLCNGPNPSA